MKNFKNAMQKLNTKAYLTTARLVANLKNNNGSHLIEVIGVIAVVLVIIGLALTASTEMTNKNLSAMGAKMDGLFS